MATFTTSQKPHLRHTPLPPSPNSLATLDIKYSPPSTPIPFRTPTGPPHKTPYAIAASYRDQLMAKGAQKLLLAMRYTKVSPSHLCASSNSIFVCLV